MSTTYQNLRDLIAVFDSCNDYDRFCTRCHYQKDCEQTCSQLEQLNAKSLQLDPEVLKGG